MQPVTLEHIASFLQKTGKKGALTLDLLGKLSPFVRAMQSQVGYEILKDDVARHEEILGKIYNEKVSEQELAEFRYLKSRLERISKRITAYLDKLENIGNSMGK